MIQQLASVQQTYHDKPELSSSQVADFLDDPICFYRRHILKDWPKKQPTPTMEFGTAVHKMIEQGEFESLAKDIPAHVLNADGHCKGKAWTDWKEANPAATYVKPGEINALASIFAGLCANKHCRKWMAEPSKNKEFEILWTHKPTGIACKSRIDLLTDSGLIVDWKTTVDCEPRKFQRSICDFNYDIRLAFYRLAVETLTGNRLPVVAVAIQNSPGFAVQPYEIPCAWLDDAETKLNEAMDEIALFDIADYVDRPIVCIDKPRWRFDDRFNLGDLL